MISGPFWKCHFSPYGRGGSPVPHYISTGHQLAVNVQCLLFERGLSLFLCCLFLPYFISYLKSIFTQQPPGLRISGLPHILRVQLCFLSVSMAMAGMCTSCLSSCRENRKVRQTKRRRERKRERDSERVLTVCRSLHKVSGSLF